ncbi:MAG: hypothetical protein K2J67_06020, partial [Lachnospiraceae bacterium]|nr:hypothetical protein [Lachnospiraceae bacterium]
MFRYSQQTNAFIRADNDKNVGLHDCKATHISWNDGELSFYFPNGFWVEQQVGACRKSFYTGEARVEFPLLYHDDTDVTIYIFTKENDKTIRDECVLEDFIKLINEKKYQLEFLYAYIG